MLSVKILSILLNRLITYPTWYEVIWFQERALLNIQLPLIESILLHHDLAGDTTHLLLFLVLKYWLVSSFLDCFMVTYECAGSGAFP